MNWKSTMENNSFTEMLIKKAIEKASVERSEKTIFAGDKRITVHGKNEKILYLPNGKSVKVSIDDSGVVTQIEENNHLHAVVRPTTLTYKIRGIQ